MEGHNIMYGMYEGRKRTKNNRSTRHEQFKNLTRATRGPITCQEKF